MSSDMMIGITGGGGGGLSNNVVSSRHLGGCGGCFIWKTIYYHSKNSLRCNLFYALRIIVNSTTSRGSIPMHALLLATIFLSIIYDIII